MFSPRANAFPLPALLLPLLLFSLLLTTPLVAQDQDAVGKADQDKGSSDAVVSNWRDVPNARIEKHRKGDLKIVLVDKAGKPVQAKFDLKQTGHHFMFGTAVAYHAVFRKNEVHRAGFRKFITDHLNAVVFENCMKWYAVEKKRDDIKLEQPDKLMQWAEENNLRVRGHCLFWAKRFFNEPWVLDLEKKDLEAKVQEHLNRMVPRYKDRLVAWDVNNEMLTGAFFESKSPGLRVKIFQGAHKLDPKTPLYPNEYAILGAPDKTDTYKALLRDLMAKGAPIHGIGIQEHGCDRFALPEVYEDALVSQPNRFRRKVMCVDGVERGWRTVMTPETMYASIDKLAELGLPITLTEISAKIKDEKARGLALEMLFRTGYSHPKVNGILLWGFSPMAHWLGKDATLVNHKGELNEAGKIFVNMLEEWKTKLDDQKTDAKGEFATRAFFGPFDLTVKNSLGQSSTYTFNFTPEMKGKTITLTVE